MWLATVLIVVIHVCNTVKLPQHKVADTVIIIFFFLIILFFKKNKELKTMGRQYHRNTLMTFSLKHFFRLKEVCLQKISWYSLWAKCGLSVRSNLTIPFMLPSFTSAKTQPYYLYCYSEMARFVRDGMHSLQVYNNNVESIGVGLCKIKWLHVDNNMLWWSWYVAVWCANIMHT